MDVLVGGVGEKLTWRREHDPSTGNDTGFSPFVGGPGGATRERGERSES